MIETPTVLILGAGASVDFGYPCGEQLLLELCQPSPSIEAVNAIVSGPVTQKQFLGFKQALTMSFRLSIDAFLEHLPEWQLVGKRAIARVLIGRENEVRLAWKYDAHERPTGSTWYRYLFERMNTSFDNFDQNQIAFVTFNYDRSLEHALTRALMEGYQKSFEEAWAKVKNLKIIHLHGMLCPYGPGSRPYRPDIDAKIVAEAAQYIRIVSEKDLDTNPEFKQAQRLLVWAERIAFLGFGYHPVNLQRLLSGGLARIFHDFIAVCL